MHATILDNYAADVGEAYRRMLEELSVLLKQLHVSAKLSLTDQVSISVEILDGEECEPEDVQERKAKVISVIGRCGGRIGSAGRRARSAIAMQHLDRLVADGHDLTATTADHLARSAGGTGLGRAARAKYGTPGRTATDKSLILDSPAAKATVAAIAKELDTFREVSTQIRERLAQQWIRAWDALNVATEQDDPSLADRHRQG